MLSTLRHVKPVCLKMAHLNTGTFLTSARGRVPKREHALSFQHLNNSMSTALASEHGIAPSVLMRPKWLSGIVSRLNLREQFARIRAVLDVYVFRTQPHFHRKIDVGIY
jgi:hypothetical protein